MWKFTPVFTRGRWRFLREVAKSRIVITITLPKSKLPSTYQRDFVLLLQRGSRLSPFSLLSSFVPPRAPLPQSLRHSTLPLSSFFPTFCSAPPGCSILFFHPLTVRAASLLEKRSRGIRDWGTRKIWGVHSPRRKRGERRRVAIYNVSIIYAGALMADALATPSHPVRTLLNAGKLSEIAAANLLAVMARCCWNSGEVFSFRSRDDTRIS